ncbi:spore germination protein [Paenibacillus polymyxa]|uniref:Spore germination protein n=1 Tax=Paenibacillus polymyxa TaxID=1406 RepID=A0AAE9IGQ6_PAEPO|nr:spore germination protein [Paenibacillus polymyxa]
MLTRWIRNVLKPGKRYTQDIEKSKQQASSEPINPSLAHTLSLLKLKLGQSSDFIIRDFPGSPTHAGQFAVCYIEGLIDQNLLQIINSQNQIYQAILSGSAVIVIDGNVCALAISIAGGARRAVEEPSSQTVIRGPKEGFTEDISLVAQREGTPFPALLEAFMMELMFEVIREAGVRMPRVIGPAVSIVGALVIGQAAVQAGLVSGAVVIVVAFTAISNFVITYFSMGSAVRLLRFALMLLAGALGLFSILMGIIPLLVHLVALKSFGINYFMP